MKTSPAARDSLDSSAPAQPAEIAVVTVVRNQGEWIDECAQSVLAQTGPALAWVVVDNASDDGTWERLQIWASRDSRIVLWRAPVNLGHAGGLAMALRFVAAPVVAILDGDDVALPGRLRRSLDWFQADERRIALYGEAEFIDQHGRAIAPWFIARDAEALRRMAEFHMPAIQSTSAWRTAWLRECVSLARQPIMAHDYFLLTRALEGGEVGFLSEALSRYRVQPRSESQSRPLSQSLLGASLGLVAALRASRKPVDMEAHMEWAEQRMHTVKSLAEVHALLARRAGELRVLRLALYHARKAIKLGRWTLLPFVGYILWSGRRELRQLLPLLRGGLLAAARVDERGRSLPLF